MWGAGQAPSSWTTVREGDSSGTVTDFGSIDLNAVRSALASYVVPPASGGNNLAVPAVLAEYVVAHSEVSSPLARRSLIAALIASDSVQPVPSVPFNVTAPDAAPVKGAAQADGQR